MKKILLVLLCGLLLSTHLVDAQTVTDGLMMPKKIFCGGFLYGNDQWKNYWEGSLKRDNGNIGTISTQSVMFMGTYGLTSKINLIAMVPYVWTKASQGTLHGMSGIQDINLTGKYRAIRKESAAGVFNAFGSLTFSTPLTSYAVDYLPLAIGMKSTKLAWRATGNYAFKQGWYVNASAAYTWRSNVSLDRTSYYTNNKLYLTDQVYIPNLFDFIVDLGYHTGPLQAEVFYTQQNTLGGKDIGSDGYDIRRQDMPFVSNRMNFKKVGALVMYYLPYPKNFAVRATGTYVVDGRNVGQSTYVAAGFLYTIYFAKK